MFNWIKRKKYRDSVLKHIKFCMLFDPTSSYPNINVAIAEAYKEHRGEAELAIDIVSSVLSNTIEKLSEDKRDEIKLALGDWFHEPDAVSTFASKAVVQIKENVRTIGAPVNLKDILWRLQYAIICVSTLFEDKLINETNRSYFHDEILGALDGKLFNQRSSERISNALHEALNLPELRESTDDDGALFSVDNSKLDMPPLTGIEHKVKLVNTSTGIVLIKASDGQQVTERRSLTQEDLEKVPSDAYNCIFVNLPAPYDQFYSCIIAQPDNQVFGDMRAFWWSLAKVNVSTTYALLGSTKMTAKAFTSVFNSARGMWDSAIEHAGSIENMRDMLVPLRNVHLEVISQMKNKTTSKSVQLGLDIAFAMILATQSEDRKLETFAFNSFKRFIWQPGEEPSEFYQDIAA
jgi:hypothetical protein